MVLATPQIDLSSIRFVVFDAMGVLYQDGDDVSAVLVPFMREKGSTVPAATAHALYNEKARFGTITSDEFWNELGMEGMTNEEYCAHYKLSPHTHEALEAIARAGYPLAVLSNDVAEWSRVLRRQFNLDDVIPTWVVSGDIHVAKPDRAAFDVLCKTLNAHPNEILFFDDNVHNIYVAREYGIEAVLFGSVHEGSIPQEFSNEKGHPSEWPTVADMDEIVTLFSSMNFPK